MRTMYAALLIACVALARPATAQQTLAAAVSEPELRQECLRWFGGKRYSGVIKNASYYYRFGRAVTVAFNTDGRVVEKDGRLVCEIRTRSESDDRRVSESTYPYYFDGRVALAINPDTSTWISFTPSGRCLWRDGRFRSHSAFGAPDEPGNIYKAGEGLWCP